MANMQECDKEEDLFSFPPSFPVVDDVIRLPGITSDVLQHIASLPVRGDEVFVATYPKSGTTWASEIVWQIYHDGSTEKTDIEMRIPHIEYDIGKKKPWKPQISSYPYPRIFRTHLQYHWLPEATTKSKYIYVVRNPKDTAVSLYHHTRALRVFQFQRNWNDLFEVFMRGKVPNGSWFDHVLGWWAHRDDPNILFLKYEDMKKDLPLAVRQIAEFVNKDISHDMVQRIANQTTFNAMKDRNLFFVKPTYSKRVQGEEKFLRKGQVGDWQNYFTEEQNQRLDELYKQRMAGTGLQLEFYT